MQYIIFMDVINFAEYSPGYEKWMVSPFGVCLYSSISMQLVSFLEKTLIKMFVFKAHEARPVVQSV